MYDFNALQQLNEDVNGFLARKNRESRMHVASAILILSRGIEAGLPDCQDLSLEAVAHFSLSESDTPLFLDNVVRSRLQSCLYQLLLNGSYVREIVTGLAMMTTPDSVDDVLVKAAKLSNQQVVMGVMP